VLCGELRHEFCRRAESRERKKERARERERERERERKEKEREKEGKKGSDQRLSIIGGSG